MTLRNRTNLWAWPLLLLLLWPARGQSFTDRRGDVILGRWLFPARGSSIEVYRAGDQYFGRIAEVGGTGQTQFGLSKNQLLIQNLTYNGSGWSGGELIHPKTGTHFDIDLTLRDAQTIRATVYKGCRWLHKEYVLTRLPAL